MKQVVLLFAMCAVVCAAASTTKNWINLFAPPYTAAPEITLGAACVDSDLCYLAGGRNGAGFGMFQFDGKQGDPLVQMSDLNKTLMILAVAAGGTRSAPKAVMGGMGFIAGALQYYNADVKAWEDSKIPFGFVTETQCIDMTKDASLTIAVAGGTSGNGLLISTDAGKTFTKKSVSVPTPNPCSAPQYIKIVDANTWYMVQNAFPSSNKSNNNNSPPGVGADEEVVLMKSPRLGYVRNVKTGAVRIQKFKQPQKMVSDQKCKGYSSQIFKTTDAGNTWVTLMDTKATPFNFGEIDCLDANTCVVSGNGFENEAGISIWSTTDGKTFKKVYSADSTATVDYTLQPVQYVSSTEVWVAGGADSRGGSNALFLKSTDGGKTFMVYQHLEPNIMEVFAMSMVNGGGIATALTQFRDSTILGYVAQPAESFFIQSHCPFKGCSFLCQNVSFPQAACMQEGGGGVIATCKPDGLHQDLYTDAHCKGTPAKSMVQPINTCISNHGQFFENYCNAGTSQDAQYRQIPMKLL